MRTIRSTVKASLDVYIFQSSSMIYDLHKKQRNSDRSLTVCHNSTLKQVHVGLTHDQLKIRNLFHVNPTHPKYNFQILLSSAPTI